MTLLAAAQEGQSRGRLLAELARAIGGRGLYAGSQDEITRPAEDPLSLLPVAFVAGQLLLNPRAAWRIVRQTVENYSLSEAAVDRIRKLPECED
jgi:hypothetical protein